MKKRKVANRRRNEGKSFVTRRGKVRSGRKMKKGCGQGCRFKYNLQYSEKDREEVFNAFWLLGDLNQQRHFLSKYAAQNKKRGREGRNQR